jgi:hypothetical protein
MEKNKLLFDIYIVLKKMKSTRLDRGLELWPLQDFEDLILLLRGSEWDSFGKTELAKIDWIIDRYFGRGEIVSGYCPKTISYEESFAAQKALDSISEYIRSEK